MKRTIFTALAALAIAALACSPVTIDVPRLDTGPTETITVNEPLPDSSEADVEISMGAGKLTLGAGAEGLAEGTIKYNVPEWEPSITNEGGKLTLAQNANGDGGFPKGEVINDWDLRLGDVPMNLTVNAGAYDGKLELGGLPLRRLTLSGGASSTTVSFDSVNPEKMETLVCRAGASTLTITGLANANFAEMEFEGGAGTFTLDFSGELQRDANVNIKAGVSTLTIVIPADTATTVTVEGGLNNVDTDGDWSVSGDIYKISGAGPTLTINVDMGVGTLTLVSK